MDDTKSARLFFERIEKVVHPEDTLICFSVDESLYYYLKRNPSSEIKDFEQLAAALNAPAPVFCLIQKKEFKKSPEKIKNRVVIRDQGEYGNRIYYLLETLPTPPSNVPSLKTD